MTRPGLTALTLLALTAPAYSLPPTLKIADEVKGAPGSWVVVSPDTTAKAVVYIGLDGLAAFPSSELRDPRKLVVFTPAAGGRWRFVAVGTLGDELATATFTVVSGDAPPPGPAPGPTPGPNPPGPAPIPGTGLRVLMVYESADLGKMPKGQELALRSRAVRDYLDSHCAKSGTQAEWRIWDQNVPTQAESPVWQAAMQLPRQSVPWLVVSDGQKGFSGPLPADEAALLAKLREFGGP